MIGFLPEIYDEEICYSWFMRYYCHSGCQGLVNASMDLNATRATHFNIEFLSRLNEDAKSAIGSIVPIRELILDHTMFPITRFADNERIRSSLAAMENQEKNNYNIVRLVKRNQKRYIRFCPCCVMEQRKKYGEAFLTRTSFLEKIGVCAKHKCRLAETDFEIKSRNTTKGFVLETDIVNMEPEFVEDSMELRFAEYVTKVFLSPMDLDNKVNVSDFLKSKLEGTKYLCASGTQKNNVMLFQDFKEYYKDFSHQGITEQYQIEKVLLGYDINLYEVCQVAFFLGVPAEELAAPKLPEKTQQELFNEKVIALHESGMNDNQIATMYGVSAQRLKRVINGNKKNPGGSIYSQKGIRKLDWEKLDAEYLPLVKEECRKLYAGDYGSPKKVSVYAIETGLCMPSKRFPFMPKCMREIEKYQESQEEYWARKVVWAYRKAKSEGSVNFTYTSRMKRLVNVKKQIVKACIPFLSSFCEEKEEEEIRKILS